MYSKVIVLALILGLAFAAPKKGHKSLVTRHTKGQNGGVGIYDGNATTIAKHPYMAGLLYFDEFECAAVILSSSYVLVLGDCVYGASASELTVVTGSSDGSTGTSYTVSKIIQHPNFTQDLDYDFALLKMKKTITFGSTVSNVTLPSKAPATSAALIVSGWGVTDDVDGSTSTMYQGTMKVQAKKTCTTAYNDYEVTFTDRMGCAYNKGKTTCCSGDSGDPFMKGNVLYGLFAGGGPTGFCTSTAIPVMYADVYSVVSWLEQYV